MPTTADYLRQLKIDKQNLVDNLKAQGVQVSDNATFTDLAPTVLDIGGKANIYVQTTEPTDKNGIWIQTDKTYDDVIADENVYASGTWEPGYGGDFSNSTSSKPWNYNGDTYLCSDMYDKLYKIVDDGVEKVTISNPSGANDGAWCQIGSKIYGTDGISGNSFAYLDLDTMTVYRDPNYKTSTYPQLYGAIVDGGDGNIYCFNCNTSSVTSTYRTCHKYDTVNHTITQAGTHATSLSTGGSISNYAYNWNKGKRAGNTIYLFMNNPAVTSGLTDDDKKHIFCMKYHIASNTFEQGFKTSIYGDKGFEICNEIIDGKIFIYSHGYGMYTIDTENNDTISKFADDYADPSEFRVNAGNCGLIGNKINVFCSTAYINGSSSTTSIKKRLILDLVSKSYQGNKVILQQYPYNPKYMAQIFSINGLKEPITNVFLYNNNTMYANLPTYIGNGTTWTLIKGTQPQNNE